MADLNTTDNKSSEETYRNSDPLFSPEEQVKRNEAVRNFVVKFREKSSEELDEIITHYIGYQPEPVEAALFVYVERGLISYDLREELQRQINISFTDHAKGLKLKRWESANSFIKYVSFYDDEKVYSILEDCRGIVIDVYHAVLSIAKERELISDDDFERFRNDARHAAMSDEEIQLHEIDEFFRDEEQIEPDLTDEQLDQEAEKYWKCPKCGEMVDMELAVCWKCEATSPETIIHPDREEVKRNMTYSKDVNYVKSGFGLIGAGVLLGLAGLDFLGTHTHYHRIVFGGLFFIIGIVFLIYGFFFNKKE